MLAETPEGAGQIGVNAAEAPLVREARRDGFRFAQKRFDPPVLAKGEQRVAHVEPEIDGQRHRRRTLGKMRDGLERALEERGRGAIRRPGRGLQRRTTQGDGRTVPGFRFAVVQTERAHVRLQVIDIPRFQGARDGTVQERDSSWPPASTDSATGPAARAREPGDPADRP